MCRDQSDRVGRARNYGNCAYRSDYRLNWTRQNSERRRESDNHAGVSGKSVAASGTTMVLRRNANLRKKHERHGRWSSLTTFIETRIQSVSLKADGSLVIRNVQLIHAGNYECKVSNLAGDDQIVYSLHVQSAAKIRTPLPEETDAVVGISIVLNCRAQGIPEPTILWEKDGTALVNDPNFQVTQTGTLRIRQPSPSDSGLYKCTAQNIVGYDTTQTYLSIKGKFSSSLTHILHPDTSAPPSIKPTQKAKYQLIENAPGTIHCQFDGTPWPQVEWMFEDKQLSAESNEYAVFPSRFQTIKVFVELNLFTSPQTSSVVSRLAFK